MSDIGISAPSTFFSTDPINVNVNNIAVPGTLRPLSPSEEDPLSLDPLLLASPWEFKIGQSPFTNPSLDRHWGDSYIRNGQPTPPPHEGKNIHVKGDTYASISSPAVESLPEVSGQRRGGGLDEEEEDHQTAHDNIDNVIKRHKSYDAKYKAGDHQKLVGLTKRQEHLERNRLAANKCRQKKKERMRLIESRCKEESEKKCQLGSEISSLRCQILDLKNEVLKHAHCADGRVGSQLAHMMKQVMHINNPKVLKSTNSVEAASASTKPATPPVLYKSQLPKLLPSNLDDTMPLDPFGNTDSLEKEERQVSEALLTSEVSHAFSEDDTFDKLINA